jgi:Family of unknown function (DUF6498)
MAAMSDSIARAVSGRAFGALAANLIPVSGRAFGALAANLIPVAGVLFGGWSAGLLLLIYWLENVVIGVFNAGRIVVVGAANGAAGLAASAFAMPFFVVHYGMFCAVHGVFVWTMFGPGLERIAGAPDPFDPRFLPALFQAVPGLWAALASILIWQSVLFIVFFIGRREYREGDPMSQMMAPYGRIVVLHVTIIAGGFIVLAMGQPVAGVVILSLLKTVLEVGGESLGGREDGKRKAAWAQARVAINAILKGRLVDASRPPSAPPPQ